MAQQEDSVGAATLGEVKEKEDAKVFGVEYGGK
jgi:hypothetical protein